MKKKTGIIVSSAAAIALCTSIIAGSTYALFTDEDTVNVAVTSGNVDVTAQVTEAELYRPTSVDPVTFAAEYSETGVKYEGTDGKNVSLENLIPGDKVTLNLQINTESTVSFKYRVSLTQSEGDEALYKNLIVGIDGTYYGENVGDWVPCEATTTVGTPVLAENVAVEIIFPAYLGNDYKNLSCDLALKVEAVQGNAVTNETAKKAYPVYSEDDLTAAVGKAEVNDTIVVMQKLGTATVETEKKGFDIKGCYIEDLTVTAPNATIDYGVDYTGKLTANAVAGNSLHIYGEVGTLELGKGRVVLGDYAKVNSVKNGNNVDETTVLEVSEKATIKTASEEVYYETLVSTEEGLVAAVANGGNVTLVNDITVNKVIYISKNISLNLNGKTIVNDVTSGRPFYMNAEGITFIIYGEVDGSGMTIPTSNTSSYGFIDMQAEDATLIVNGGSYTGDTDDGGLFKPRRNGWKIELNGVTASTNCQIVAMNVDGELNVTGGKYYINDNTVIADYKRSGFFIQASDRHNTEGVIATFDGVTMVSTSRCCVDVGGATAVLKNCNIGTPNGGVPGYISATVAVSYMGTVVIEGGEYEADFAVYVWSTGGKINISGGKFVGNKAAVKADIKDNCDCPLEHRVESSIVNITDGIFNGNVEIATKAELNILGGTFNRDISSYIDTEEYEIIQDGETWVVTNKT